MPTEQLWFAPVLLSLLAVTALVISDFRDWKFGRYLFKPLAAVAFLWLAFRLGALDSTFGSWLFGGLCLCMLGDLFLMPDSERSFLAGLIAFLMGHLLFALAFLQLHIATTGLYISVIPVLVLMGFVVRWLLPHVDANMKIPVTIYVAVITSMLLCAGATAGHPAQALIICGAWGFALSDLAVARQQFVKPHKLNPLWGTPLYFFSQMLLAGSVAFV